MKLIERKVASGGKSLPAAHEKTARVTNVIDLASVLQRSLDEAAGGKKSSKAAKPRKTAASERKRRRAA
jgi:non-homologous end joining protein Ku